jgi:hypothetical protein
MAGKGIDHDQASLVFYDVLTQKRCVIRKDEPSVEPVPFDRRQQNPGQVRASCLQSRKHDRSKRILNIQHHRIRRSARSCASGEIGNEPDSQHRLPQPRISGDNRHRPKRNPLRPQPLNLLRTNVSRTPTHDSLGPPGSDQVGRSDSGAIDRIGGCIATGIAFKQNYLLR